jgi:hypothetical protein
MEQLMADAVTARQREIERQLVPEAFLRFAPSRGTSLHARMRACRCPASWRCLRGRFRQGARR